MNFVYDFITFIDDCLMTFIPKWFSYINWCLPHFLLSVQRFDDGKRTKAYHNLFKSSNFICLIPTSPCLLKDSSCHACILGMTEDVFFLHSLLYSEARRVTCNSRSLIPRALEEEKFLSCFFQSKPVSADNRVSPKIITALSCNDESEHQFYYLG